MRFSSWALAASLVTASGVAYAEDAAPDSTAGDDEARRLFTAGRDALESGEPELALDYFQRSYELSERPELLFNIGVAADRLRRDDVALDAFERYIEELPDAGNRPDVEARVRVLRARLADETARQADEDRDARESSGVLGAWWFWTIVGAVVVGAGVTIGVVAASSGGAQDPIPGDGGVFMTLLAP